LSEQAHPGSLVILVADDQAGLRRMLQEVFAEDGHTVWLAAGGQQAVALVREHRPDVALIDLKMPGMSGLDALREIRLIAPELPVVVMTAYGETDIVSEAYSLGARCAIPKPFDIDVVRQEVYRAAAEAQRPIAAEGRPPYGGE